MYSSDSGNTWFDRSINGNPDIMAIHYDDDQGVLYATDEDGNAWKSEDEGLNWQSFGSFPGLNPKDIFSTGGHVYLGGSGTSKAWRYDLSEEEWDQIETGLFGVNQINRFSRVNGYPWLYTATDNGIYKTNIYVTTPVWEPRNNGMAGTTAPDMGSIIQDPNNRFAILASTSPTAVNPGIWATCDSAKYWVNIFNGGLYSHKNSHRSSIPGIYTIEKSIETEE